MNQLDSTMKSFANKLFETYGTRCPNCGELLLRPKVLNKVTGKKMHGACFNCGYKEPLPTHTTPTNEKLSEQARKDATLKYFNAYSIYSSFKVFNHRFDNYIASTSAKKLVKQRCQKLANQIAEEQTIHTMLLGNTGVGKTHLAVAMMYRIFELTHYRQHGMFIDWRQLIADKKAGISQPDLQRKVAATLHQLPTADFVIIDDLGSERTTDFSLDLVDQLWRYRENLSTIVTSNLIGSAFQEKYGNRAFSRMANHGVGNTILFSDIEDHRMGALG